LDYRPQIHPFTDEVAGLQWIPIPEVKRMIAKDPKKWTLIAKDVMGRFY